MFMVYHREGPNMVGTQQAKPLTPGIMMAVEEKLIKRGSLLYLQNKSLFKQIINK